MQTEKLQNMQAWIWRAPASSMPRWQRELRRFAQILMLTGRDITHGMLTLRAMSLVYTTLLSFVPLIAVSFSVLKGFGVHNQVEPLLLNFLAPLGDKSDEITHNIVGFVENMKIGVLGALGLGILMFTVISLIQKIEAALNFTWRLESSRNLSQRFSNYLSVVMVGPVLVFSAIGLTASLRSHTMVTMIESLPYMGELIRLVGLLVPSLMIIAAFTFVYILVPNTRVRFGSALYGAVIAGILWRITGALFASFASGSTSYTAIYSGFAIILLFMIWLYLGWLILLIGASIAYYHQHPEQRRWRTEIVHLSSVLKESLALQLMVAIGRDHLAPAEEPLNVDLLARQLNVPQSLVSQTINVLLDAGFIARVNELGRRLVPAQSIDRIRLIDIIERIRLAEDGGLLHQAKIDAAVENLQQGLDACQRQTLGDKTVRDIIDNQ